MLENHIEEEELHAGAIVCLFAHSKCTTLSPPLLSLRRITKMREATPFRLTESASRHVTRQAFVCLTEK